MTLPNDAEEDRFEWLRHRTLTRTYVSYSEFSDHSVCSFDIGHEGYAASCNHGGELLQMTAPSKEHGIIFARGGFDYSLYSTLARAQREHGAIATFGLKVPWSKDITALKCPTLCLGDMVDRGSFNYRWPFNQYTLCVKHPTNPLTTDGTDASSSKSQDEVGTCSTLSFIRNGTLYQVLRLDYECRADAKVCHKVPDETELQLELEPPLQFQTFRGSSENMFEDNDLSDDECTFSIKGPLKTIGTEAGSEVFWQASVSEYNLHTGYRTDLRLKELRKKKDHYWKHSNQKLNVYTTKNPLQPGITNRKSGGNKSHVFVAVFRLYVPVSTNNHPTPQYLTTDEISKFLSIKSHSPLATASMWQSIFLHRQEKLKSVSALGEADLVGRCLEKILQVDLVPEKCLPPTQWAVQPLALVSNLFLKADVDLKSLFWKVRFLIKADEFLSQYIKKNKSEPSPIPETREFNDSLGSSPEHDWHELTTADDKGLAAQVTTIRRIRHAIGNIIAYLVRAYLESRHETEKPPILLPESGIPGESNYYYVMITLCYVFKHYPKAKWAWEKEMGERGKIWQLGLLGSRDRLPSRRHNPLGSDRNAGSLLKEKDALLKWLHHESVVYLKEREGGSGSGRGTLIPASWKDDKEKTKELMLKASTAIARRIASGKPYRADDEIVDRLAFLAKEMWSDSNDAKEDAKFIADCVTKRIENREFTTVIKPCPPQPEKGIDTGSPWEIHALCHHSRMLVAAAKPTNTNGQALKQEIEEDIEKYRRKFCPFLTTEGTLVPSWERTSSAARRGFLRSEATAVLGSTILDVWKLIDQMHPGADADDKSTDEEKPLTVEDLLARQSDMLERYAQKMDNPAHIDYLIFKPPQRHHPKEFFRSLDDTPYLYKKSRLGKVRVPATIQKVLKKEGKDIKPETTEIRSDNLTKEEEEVMKLLHVVDIKDSDPTAQNAEMEKVDNVRKFIDSLVDQGVRHRIIVAPTCKRLPADLLRLLTYVLHRRMKDCFENHTMRVSKFFLRKKETVKVHITLRSWALQHSTKLLSSNAENPMDTQGFITDEKICLPDELLEAFQDLNRGEVRNAEPPIMCLKVSSIGISTNTFGDFSQCTVVTDIISDDERKALECTVRNIWDAFIHQPQAGRFLVFSVILARICEGVAFQYDEAVEMFVDKFKFDNFNTTYLTDAVSPHDQDSVARLQVTMWSLEALNKLSNTMAMSVKEIEHAKAKLDKEIEDGPGKRSEDLERICVQHQETLERSLAQLVAVQDKLERKVDLASRYSNALSTVLTLRDSRESYKQNNTIQKLTYITIGCLPIGLTAAIFAVPEDQYVIKQRMGLGWFIGLCIILFIAIFIISIFLDSIINTLRDLKRKWKRRRYWAFLWNFLRLKKRLPPPGEKMDGISIGTSRVSETNDRGKSAIEEV